MENLKPTAPTIRIGRRTLALEQREWKGQPQLSLIEVTPVLDKDNQLESWQPTFKGTRLNGSPKDIKALGEWLLAVLGSKTA